MKSPMSDGARAFFLSLIGLSDFQRFWTEFMLLERQALVEHMRAKIREGDDRGAVQFEASLNYLEDLLQQIKSYVETTPPEGTI